MVFTSMGSRPVCAEIDTHTNIDNAGQIELDRIRQTDKKETDQQTDQHDKKNKDNIKKQDMTDPQTHRWTDRPRQMETGGER